jgi:hypothetical protein
MIQLYVNNIDVGTVVQSNALNSSEKFCAISAAVPADGILIVNSRPNGGASFGSVHLTVSALGGQATQFINSATIELGSCVVTGAPVHETRCVARDFQTRTAQYGTQTITYRSTLTPTATIDGGTRRCTASASPWTSVDPLGCDPSTGIPR